MTASLKIGNAQGFWGDRSDAAAELLAAAPDLDYLTMDYLAEVSMSILAMQRERDSSAGYARDFVDVVRSLAPSWAAGGMCRLIVNAGGLNPRGCAEACREALRNAGCREMKIAVVTGDDVLPFIRENAHREPFQELLRNLDTGAAIADVLDRLVTANAYVGAAPIVEALARGAEIVITGRTADPSLTVAAAVHHFGWEPDDWDRLAGATVAGHLIECGTQVTGGISTDWLEVPDPLHVGFPVVEISGDGNCVVTKPGGTGGCVSERTVKEQLVYEIGDPGNYVSPDVRVSFLGLQVEQVGDDRVQVRGAAGMPPPETFKVSATWRDGYRAAGTLTIAGRNAVAKARRCGEVVLCRVLEAGFSLRETLIECLGSGESLLAGADGDSELLETVLRIAVDAESHDAVERFTKELMPLVTAGPQGTTGYAEGRPRVHPVFRYWPCLISRETVATRVEMLAVPETTSATPPPCRSEPPPSPCSPLPPSGPFPSEAPERRTARLYDLAHARSGDKGMHANVGVIARRPEDFQFLSGVLTAERVAEFFQRRGVDSVVRYELPNLHALNFVLKGILKSSLRTDAQGKALGQALLEMEMPV